MMILMMMTKMFMLMMISNKMIIAMIIFKTCQWLLNWARWWWWRWRRWWWFQLRWYWRWSSRPADSCSTGHISLHPVPPQAGWLGTCAEKILVPAQKKDIFLFWFEMFSLERTSSHVTRDVGVLPQSFSCVPPTCSHVFLPRAKRFCQCVPPTSYFVISNNRHS